MTISLEFKKTLDEKNARLTRIMLKDSLIYDPTFKSFDEMCGAAEKVFPQLYDQHDGETLNLSTDHWTKDYMNEQMVKVIINFSKERIAFLKKICAYLYRDRIKKISSQRTKATHKVDLPHKQVGSALGVGGIAVAALGCVVAQPVVITVGITTAVAGGIISRKNNKQ